MSVCPSVRLSVLRSASLFQYVPRPLLRPQTAQTCDPTAFMIENKIPTVFAKTCDAHNLILTEMCVLINTYRLTCSHQYLD